MAGCYELLNWDRSVSNLPHIKGQSLNEFSLTCEDPLLDLTARFNQLKNDLPRVAYILSLLCFATTEEIPNVMLERPKMLECLIKTHWSYAGEPETVCKPEIISEFDSSIEKLISLRFILSKSEIVGQRIPSMTSNLQQ